MAFALLASASASADPPDAHLPSPSHTGDVRFDVHANMGGFGMLGAGLRIDVPIVHNGVIEGIDDELAVSPGLDAYFAPFYHNYYNGGAYFLPSCVVQWNFYIDSHWSVFPEAGLALYVGNRDFLPRGQPIYATADVGVGGRYQFSDRTALLARVSSPTGLQIGVTF